MKYEINKLIKLNYQVEAEGPDEALAAPVPSDVVMSTIKERARDLDKAPASASVIRDRTLRAGRVFTRTYKGDAYTATVLPGGRIRITGDKIGAPTTCKNLHVAAQIAIELSSGTKHSANAWQFWAEQTPSAKKPAAEAAPEPTEPATAEEPAPEPTPEPAPTPAKKSAAMPARTTGKRGKAS